MAKLCVKVTKDNLVYVCTPIKVETESKKRERSNGGWRYKS